MFLQSGVFLWAQETENTKKEDARGSSQASSAGEISAPQLAGLPLNGRSYGQLATLQAGMSDSSAEQSSRGGGGGNLIVAGGRPSSNNFLLDGTNVMNTDNLVPRSAAGVQLGSDAVFQVQVFSGNYGADYGRGSGGVLNSITRSGTENFRGTLFEYFRNSKLDSRNFFDPDSPPPFKRNQFGFTLTGPLRKNRLFFMTSFEALRDRLTETAVNYLPDVQARQGVITDASGNIIQVVTVAAGVKPYLALYPFPNSIRVGRGAAQSRDPQFLLTNENFFVVRLDQKLSDSDSLFGRYTIDDATSDVGAALFVFTNRSQSRFQYLTAVESHIFSPRVLGSFRFGYTQPQSNTNSLSAIEIPRELYFVPGAPQFGQIFHSGLTPFGPSSDLPSGNWMNSYQLSGDLWASKGSHALKFGVDVHRYGWRVFSNTDRGAAWRFNSFESYLTAGVAGADLAVALPGSDNTKNYRQTMMGFAVQDGYALTRRLQINVGLRYELATLLHDRDGKTSFLADPARDTVVQIGPYLASNPSLKNFAPRLSFAWSPFAAGKTVLRGGFGIYYDQLLAYVVDSRKNSVPFHNEVVRVNFDASPYFPNAVAAAMSEIPISFRAQVMDYRHTDSPMVLRYSFALQQQLGAGWRVQASYVGARGNHLFRSYESNLFPTPIRRPDGSLFFPPNQGATNPAFAGGINILATDAQSFYNSLQVTLNKTLSAGISMQGNYTYSKSVDDASTIGLPAGSPAAAQTPYTMNRNLERGLSDFDLRHRLAVSFFYTVPTPDARRGRSSALVNSVLRGWRLGGIFSYRSGTPFSPAVNVVTPGYRFSPYRPNLLPGHSNNPVKGVSAGCGRVPAGQKLGTPDQYFDPCVFDVPAPGTLGNLGRNTIIAASALSLDISLQKDFRLTPGKQLQFRAEIFNLPNHPNFNRIATGSLFVYSGYPGRLNPTTGIVQSTATTARQIQFALRLSF